MWTEEELDGNGGGARCYGNAQIPLLWTSPIGVRLNQSAPVKCTRTALGHSALQRMLHCRIHHIGKLFSVIITATMRVCSTTSLGLALIFSAVCAEKDDSYYAAGVKNPNVDKAMYWREPYNVLEDLDLFSKLYIRFHSCAWTELTNNEQEGGGGGDESDSWYLGSAAVFGPSASYSLYGILDGNRDRGCRKATYITSLTTDLDSFVSTLVARGFTDFVQASGDDHNDDSNDDNVDMAVFGGCNGSGEGGSGDGDGDGESYGVACSGESFVQATFASSTCDGNYVSGVTDPLEVFNAAIKDTGCVAIYDAAVDAYSDDEEDNKDDENGGSPLSMILYSQTCGFRDSYCPDPYGKLAAADRALEKATGSIDYSRSDHAKTVTLAFTFFIAGGFCLAAAFFLIVLSRRECKKIEILKTLRARFKKRQKAKRSMETSSPSTDTQDIDVGSDTSSDAEEKPEQGKKYLHAPDDEAAAIETVLNVVHPPSP